MGKTDFVRHCCNFENVQEMYGKKRVGCKQAKRLEQVGNVGKVLTCEECTMFRAHSARAMYLSMDSPDLKYSAKELCRDFSVPTIQSLDRLKRLIRFLKGLPRLVYLFAWQQDPKGVTLCVDTDFAGCKVTRRSTSGGVALRGTHCLRHWSSTQPTIALSSGEAELGGLSKGIAQGIGLRSIAADLGITLPLTLKTDATAAMGMARRLGIGKIRHLDTALLWVQQAVRSGEVDLQKVAGAENPGDAFTKYLPGRDLNTHMDRLGLVRREGRPRAAPARCLITMRPS